jgi:DNA mismatch repair protein MutS2
MLKENARLKTELEKTLDREQHQQRLQLLREQNKNTSERLAYLKEMERKLKQIIFDWRKNENKQEVIRQMQALLFKQKDKPAGAKTANKTDSPFVDVQGEIKAGDQVRMKKNRQTGIVREMRGKKAVVQIGTVPMTLLVEDLVKIREKEQTEPPKEAMHTP